MTRRRWGRAGVRLSDREAKERDMRAGAQRLAREQARQDAHRLWQQRKLVPARITAALDLRGLHGPQVDQECGAAEPDVDRWEAGELYPTWEQLQALAVLTDLPLAFFFIPHPPGPAEEQRSTLRFHWPTDELTSPPVTAFAAEAFAAAPTPVQERLW